MNKVEITLFKDPRNLDLISGFVGRTDGVVLSYESLAEGDTEFSFNVNKGLFEVSIDRKSLLFQVQSNYLSEKFPEYDKVFVDVFRSMSSVWSSNIYGCRNFYDGKPRCCRISINNLPEIESGEIAISRNSLILPTGKLEWQTYSEMIEYFLLLDFIVTF